MPNAMLNGELKLYGGKLKMEVDQTETDSVYDFLYVDHDRVGLLPSQLDPNGVLTEIVKESAEGSGSERGLDLKLVKLGTSENGRTALNKRFNTRWLISLLFLDRAKNILKRDMSDAQLGNIVLASGVLCLLHTEMLQTLYQSESLPKIAMRRAQSEAKKANVAFDRETAQLEIDAIAGMNRQVQMHLFRGADPRLFSTLRIDGLVTPPSELTVKYGTLVDGEWNVVGILDAQPGQTSEETLGLLSGRFEGQAFLQESIRLSHLLRNIFGRPQDAYGLTPLLIFRTVS